MITKPNIEFIFAVIQAAEAFLESLPQAQEAYLRQAYIAEKRDSWILKFDALYENEAFTREIILCITMTTMDVKLISDLQLK